MMHNQRGLVLAGSLVIVSALLVAGLGARMMLQSDHRTAANLKSGTRLFYVAAAGVEWAKSEILSSAGLVAAPAPRTVPYSNGRFSVNFASPTNLGPLSAAFAVQSSGFLGGNSHALEARLTKSYDLGDSAIGLRGNISAVNLSGAGLRISGLDHDPTTGQPSGNLAARPALSADTQALRDLIAAAALSLPAGSLQSGAGGPAVSASNHLASATLSQLAGSLCASPGAVSLVMPNAGSLTLTNQSWGTQAAPALRCIDGLASPGDIVSLAGTDSGVGILIVRDAQLVVAGTFRWEGLILVTGSDVAVHASASSASDIYGSLLINELGMPSYGAASLALQGSFRALFSRSALNRAAALIPSPQLNALYASLPASLKQEYWRSVTP